MIPFIRKLPHGRGAVQNVSRPKDIEEAAMKFLLAGGWYTSEILYGGVIRIAATDSNLREVIWCESPNGPVLDDAIDDLVERSQTYLTYFERIAAPN